MVDCRESDEKSTISFLFVFNNFPRAVFCSLLFVSVIYTKSRDRYNLDLSLNGVTLFALSLLGFHDLVIVITLNKFLFVYYFGQIYHGYYICVRL